MKKNNTLIKNNKILYGSIHDKYKKETIKRISTVISKEEIGINNLKDKIAADIGCGRLGLGAINLINLGFNNIFLFDLSKQNVIHAKKNIIKLFKNTNRNLNIQIKYGNLEKFKFKKNFFDFVLCQGVLHHIENDIRCLKNIYKSMKNKAIFILTVQGKGGLITNITYDILATEYHSNLKVKKFFNSIFNNSKKLYYYINFLKKNTDQNGKKFLDLFLKLANEDFLQTLEDRIRSQRYYRYSFLEIKKKLKSVGFQKIQKISKLSKYKYKNLRQIFNSMYLEKNNYLSKVFYGEDSSHINLRIIK